MKRGRREEFLGIISLNVGRDCSWRVYRNAYSRYAWICLVELWAVFWI